jgi:hypothetical protein
MGLSAGAREFALDPYRDWPKLTPFQRQEALQRLADGESQADVARAYNVDPAAICRLAAAAD